MDVVVTGGAGFIGSTLVDRLLGDGHRVHVMDNFSSGCRQNLAAAESSGMCTVFELDINGPELASAMAAASPEIVFHLAAQVGVHTSVNDPLADAAVNVLGTINVAQAASGAGVRKVVFASSGGAIYGNAGALPLGENAPSQPISPYGAGKAAAEVYLNTYGTMHGLNCSHVALSNTYGPRQDHRAEAGVVAAFADALLTGKPTRLFGDGSNTRDYVYVDDVVDALVRTAIRGRAGARYNIGTGEQTTDRELHAIVAEVVGARDAPEFVPARLGDVRASALDASAAYRDLGWTPRMCLAEGVRRTIAHISQQAVISSVSFPAQVQDDQALAHATARL
ncbi:NAD-dependent epimerase/dehydratase family protein [Saccharopolyspora aridisoli]|uniref:NAD-dependent epimerase/dehydratase family protein n=1 Tax=Saccharopolyspora aridisoli TaxID=2530385 RepID=A0A4R4UGM6_9PSEU|nr:NAD-dependent epimerase/dehydratase family protein [Saccharopolyspora aridisoli]TDC90978.1 NAD-dependent epimerase/dehydratase family protein [Saccharopolyspora aridisoli]